MNHITSTKLSYKFTLRECKTDRKKSLYKIAFSNLMSSLVLYENQLLFRFTFKVQTSLVL